MFDRINLRLTATERNNLSAIAQAIHSARTEAAAWHPVTISDAVRMALEVGAQVARAGTLPAA